MPVRIPENCSSITFTTSGVRTPTARVISSITSAEETALVANAQNVSRIVTTNQSNGQTQIQLPSIITSITINGNIYAVTSGLTPATIPAADATAFLGNTFNQPFELVSGV